MKTLFPALRAAKAIDLTLKKVVVTNELGMSCDIYLAGEKLGTFIDRADGGMPQFHLTQEARAMLIKVTRASNLPTLPPLAEDDPLYSLSVARGPLNDQDFIEQVIVNLMLETKELSAMKRTCKTHTVIVMKEHEPGHYSKWKHPFTEETRKGAVAQFGDKIDFIVNEDIATL